MLFVSGIKGNGSELGLQGLKPLLFVARFGWAKAQPSEPSSLFRLGQSPALRTQFPVSAWLEPSLTNQLPVAARFCGIQIVFPLTNQRQISKQVKLTYALAADKEGCDSADGWLAREASINFDDGGALGGGLFGQAGRNGAGHGVDALGAGLVFAE